MKIVKSVKAADSAETGAELTVAPVKSTELSAAINWRHLLASAHEKSRVTNWLAYILGPNWRASWEGDRLMLRQQEITADCGPSAIRAAKSSVRRSCNVICDGRRICAQEPSEPELSDALAFAIAKIAKCVNWPKVEVRATPGFQASFRRYALHEADFYNWTIEAARVLKQRRPASIDWESLVEELEDLGISQERALQSHLRVLLTHLLKWVYEPSRQGKSWKLTIENARDEVKELIDRNPGLSAKIISILSSAYRKARRDAACETTLDENAFPLSIPWSFEEIVDDNFWPALGTMPTRVG